MSSQSVSNVGGFVLFALLAGTIGLAEGIRCYQCGTYIATSVTPCQNLTSEALKECLPQATHCSKYSGPAINVYGCETDCEERVQNSFEIHCCNEDRCNGGESSFKGLSLFWMICGPATIVATFLPSIMMQPHLA